MSKERSTVKRERASAHVGDAGRRKEFCRQRFGVNDGFCDGMRGTHSAPR